MTIYLLQFNNYYNRQVKGFDSIAEYPYPVGSYYEMQFNPNDGINTKIILNTDQGENCDYCIICNDDGSINSRWFVIEAVRKRNSQYEFSLYRDLVFDYKEQILDAPCFIEKATLDVSNPLIFNKEDFGVNQIKNQELLLKDLFALPWVVAYIKKETAKTIKIAKPDFIVDTVVNNLEQYPYYLERHSLITQMRDERIYIYYNIRFSSTTDQYDTYACCWDQEGHMQDFTKASDAEDLLMPLGTGKIGAGKKWGYSSNLTRLGVDGIDAPVVIAKSAVEEIPQIRWDQYDLSSYIFPDDPGYIHNYDDLQQLGGKVIFETDTGKYYKTSLKLDVLQERKVVDLTPDSNIGQAIHNLSTRISYIDSNNYINPIGSISAAFSRYQLIFEEISESELSINIPSYRAHTNNAPYDIIAIPIGTYKIELIKEGISYEYTQKTSEIVSYMVAAALSDQLGDDLIDIQMLPYAPINKLFIRDTYHLDLDEADNKYMSLLTEEGTSEPWGVMFFVEEEDFSSDLYTDDPGGRGPLKRIDIAQSSLSAIDMKIQNECREYRIVSPNYASIFSINAAKNKGIKNLRADCTYKPFNPYIRVYPEFNLLYGDNFGDNRGMIVSGDFSLPRSTNDWINYQLQNKNFINSFDRQIDNLEFNNRLAMREAVWNASTGAIGAGVQTGITTSAIAGPYAGAAAGIAAAGISGFAGGMDIDILRKRQAESLDYTKDQFGYQLGNIKARHDTVAKVSSFDINSKVWPFIEIYKCTEIEEEAFRNKLKWNGMTVGVIGTIRAYMRSEETYIKGKIIRLSDLGIDYHLSTEIAGEIYKGVFI